MSQRPVPATAARAEGVARARPKESRNPEAWLPFVAGLRGFVRRRVPTQDADDVTQDILLRLHQQASTLRDAGRAESWIFAIARRAIADHYRQRRPGGAPVALLAEERVEELVDPAAEPHRGFGTFSGGHSPHEEVLSWLRPLAEELPEIYSQALIEADFAGRSHGQLAKEWGISLSGAKSRVQRARKMLGEALQQCCRVEIGDDGRVSDFQRQDFQRQDFQRQGGPCRICSRPEPCACAVSGRSGMP